MWKEIKTAPSTKKFFFHFHMRINFLHTFCFKIFLVRAQLTAPRLLWVGSIYFYFYFKLLFDNVTTKKCQVLRTFVNFFKFCPFVLRPWPPFPATQFVTFRKKIWKVEGESKISGNYFILSYECQQIKLLFFHYKILWNRHNWKLNVIKW